MSRAARNPRFGNFTSTLIAFWLRHKGKMQGNNYQIDKQPLLEIPIYNPTEAEKAEIENKVEQILDAKRENPQADTSELEGEIDDLVYKLYDLSKDEIRIVEGKD